VRPQEKQRWASANGYVTISTEWEPAGWEFRVRKGGSTVLVLDLHTDEGRALSAALANLDWDASIEEDE
jgi:hypothetical protein